MECNFEDQNQCKLYSNDPRYGGKCLFRSVKFHQCLHSTILSFIEIIEKVHNSAYKACDKEMSRVMDLSGKY